MNIKAKFDAFCLNGADDIAKTGIFQVYKGK